MLNFKENKFTQSILKMKNPKERIKIMDSEQFLSDPIAFGFLMEYQYGSGDNQAEKFIFDDNSIEGIALSEFEDIQEILPNIDFWLKLSEKWREHKPTLRLYVNNNLESRQAAKYIAYNGHRFELIKLDRETVNIQMNKVKLPVLVRLNVGCPHWGFEYIKWYIDQKQQ